MKSNEKRSGKKSRRRLALTMIAAASLFLAACGKKAINSSSTGFWDHTILYNLSEFIVWLSKIFGGYGMGIIMITLIIRIIILPLMIYQTRSMRKMQEIQPQISALQKKYSSRDTATQQKLQEETRKLYAEVGYNPVSGCLPLLVQMPIIWALYQAIYRTDVLKTGSFLWMQLGDRDPYFVLPILAAVFTFLSSWLSTKSQPETNSMNAVMVWGMPVIIFFTAMSVPAALSLYWVISNAFQAGQTLLIQNPWKIIREREATQTAKKEHEKARERAVRKARRGPNR
ncbi:preprotein translocase subunit YidC [Furfurilactobacillus siliginis]|uniref:Membrane protein insertase YidC n=2 Tax=Furfurilactobacillus siliginis TaxID=348151 RepID=A0A0R2LH38_9LACO|nr:preprotein translocase subunit YidC [Furfurilactobacillus siliginis]GEK28994.1 membrane protein insertase YidC 2 [Furfurilactobacillus siliginis]